MLPLVILIDLFYRISSIPPVTRGAQRCGDPVDADLGRGRGGRCGHGRGRGRG